ncbi:RNA polymerase sigma factor [Aquimarina sp. 2201CG5-10]|uniref:RNA polymerase sigma factor n=1 Tax=Aquimarina callyspongiae TaxID=3098150 RepID=UPI002AB32ED6|nr:RNA polymerase sigma factor [Aquimarina sp. 2201CG5-10]MDY8138968.1 RNA polymerase sigma factor [Aquimarina sp. 2201CG5-10]
MSKTHKIFDSLLILQCQSGNKRAVALLVKRWHTKLCRQAYWYVNDVEVSKDIAQDSWSKILLKINSLKDPNSFGSWALSIVNRSAIDWIRKHKRELHNLDSYQKTYKSESVDKDDEDQNELMIMLKNSIKELPKNQQMVLHLFYVEEYSIKQMSDILNISVGTVKSRLFNAREKLKLIIKDRNYEK